MVVSMRESMEQGSGRRTPGRDPAAARLAASNRRTVGPSGEAGIEGAGTPFRHGDLGSTKAHPSAMNRRTVQWRDEAQCRWSATGERDATGERSVSLAKMAW